MFIKAKQAVLRCSPSFSAEETWPTMERMVKDAFLELYKPTTDLVVTIEQKVIE